MSNDLRRSLSALGDRWLNRALNAQRRGQFEHREGYTQNYLFGTHLGFENASIRLKELLDDKTLAGDGLLETLYQLADTLDDLAQQMVRPKDTKDKTEGLKDGTMFGLQTPAAELRDMIDRHERLAGGLL